MTGFLICPLCLSVFIFQLDEGDECPQCEMGELEDFDEFQNQLTTSFFYYLDGSDE